MQNLELMGCQTNPQLIGVQFSVSNCDNQRVWPKTEKLVINY